MTTLALSVQKRRGDFSLDVDVQATAGVVALFGRSGCGKSTAVDLLAGLLRADSGRIQIGDDVLFDSAARIDVPAERRRIGYVFQDARLFPHYTVLGNLEYGMRRAAGVPRYVELEQIVRLLALEPMLDRRPRQLSGGERQRVAIGRALLSQPRMLLLDEPLASLDRARRDEVLPYLERLRDTLSIPMVYVSHQFDEVLRLATHVVLMDRGRVVAQGDLQSMSLRPELRDIVGAEAVGAVLEGRVTRVHPDSGLARIELGRQELYVDGQGLAAGQRVRLQLLARDLILSLDAPQRLSVRNALQGVVERVLQDEPNAALVEVDVGGARLVARVTQLAVNELALGPGRALWVLVKAVTLRGHVFPATPVAS
jgi:molybdate transport system ATP-binding protein